MTEAELKAIIAKQQNTILSRVFENISSDGVDTSIDLSDINSLFLSDFWIYTSGYLGIQNFENTMFSEKEVELILNGSFELKELSPSEIETMCKNAQTKPPDQYRRAKVELYKIQDGTYFLTAYPKKYYYRTPVILNLETDPVVFDDKNPAFAVTPHDKLAIIRNLLAHSTPYVDGSKLKFYYHDSEIVLTKMWLRGYSELFAQKSSTINPKQLQEMLYTQLTQTGNMIDNTKDVDKALSLISTCFDENQRKNFFRLNNFVKIRLLYENDFYSKSLDEKIKIISQICAKNPNYIQGNCETINPSIIYNLQQLVSKELTNRGVEAILSDDDLDSEEYYSLLKQKEETLRKCANLDNNFAKNTTSRFVQMQNERLIKELKGLITKFNKHCELLERKRKLESSHMDMCDLEGLETLSVETAVNTVCLMAYNSLVTSAFYEDLLAYTSFDKLTEKQKIFFNGIKINNIAYSVEGQKFDKKFNPTNKCFILSGIRNAICHGLVTYHLPPVKQGEKVDFKDVCITFHNDIQNCEISGKLIDFYNLFSSKDFTKQRPHEIITGEICEMGEDEELEEFLKTLEEPIGTQPGDEDN